MPQERSYLLGHFSMIWDFLKSVKLAIVLLLSLAATSIIGTLIPQNESPENYRQALGERFYRIFDVFDVFGDIFKTQLLRWFDCFDPHYMVAVDSFNDTA